MMKVRTTITLSDDLVARIDALAGKGGNRSAVIERLLRKAVRRIEKRRQYREEVEKLNRFTDENYDWIMENLSFQADPFDFLEDE
jgi:metal-responsive CopG/Arc/MetJ family transcriptional regulator